RLPSAPPRLSGEPVALAGASMGTTWSARLALPPGVTRQQAQAAIAAALDEVVAQMSTWEAGSDISRFNRAATGWQALPEALFHVLSHALDLADASGGAYDPTIGALVDAWGFGAGPRVHEPPAAAAIAAALAD
ncbi:FAD:protein FMN transferase, partial [Bordetella pertussis]